MTQDFARAAATGRPKAAAPGSAPADAPSTRPASAPASEDRFRHLDVVTERVIGAAMALHRALGPGLLQSAYQAYLAAELGHRGVSFQREVAVPLLYRGERLDRSYRLDFLVENRVIVEVKAVAKLDPVFTAQTLT